MSPLAISELEVIFMFEAEEAVQRLLETVYFLALKLNVSV